MSSHSQKILKMVYISPGLALTIDTVATFVCQGGYTIQKKGHMSVEAGNAQQVDPRDRKSGFLTGVWIFGFFLSCLAGLLHAGKSLSKVSFRD